MFSPASELLDDVRAYRPFDERERTMRDRLVAFLETYGLRAFDRALPPGHVTASAWIVDPDRTHAVLHHRKLERWLQLGGRRRRRTCRAARRRAKNRGCTLRDRGARLRSTCIAPARTHPNTSLRLRFALEADPREPLVRNGESHDVRWVALSDLIVRDRRLGAPPRGKDCHFRDRERRGRGAQ